MRVLPLRYDVTEPLSRMNTFDSRLSNGSISCVFMTEFIRLSSFVRSSDFFSSIAFCVAGVASCWRVLIVCSVSDRTLVIYTSFLVSRMISSGLIVPVKEAICARITPSAKNFGISAHFGRVTASSPDTLSARFFDIPVVFWR